MTTAPPTARLRDPPRFDPGWGVITTAVVVVVALVVAGRVWYGHQVAEALREAGANVSAVGDLKLAQIVQWRDERRADLEVIRESPNTIRGLEVFVLGDRRTVNVDRLRSWLRTVTMRGYSNASLLDRHYRVLVTSGPGGHSADSMTLATVEEAFRTGTVVFGPLHRPGPGEPPRMDLVAPLRRDGRGGAVFAALVLQIDPSLFLYPLLRSWPTPSRTAEVLLVRREGDDALFLNDVRHRAATALALRVPLADSALPAARALLGDTGLIDGADYRGVPVLASVRRVPGEPAWAIVAKIDRAEVLAPVRRLAWLTALFVAALIAGVAAAATAVWRQRHARHYRELYEAEVRSRALSQHYEYLTRYANDMIFLADERGTIVEANDRALEVYGFAREEMLRLRVQDLLAPGDPVDVRETMREVAERGGAVYESVHRRKDGSTFPIEVSARLITIDGTPFFQGIARDVSERKRHERRIADLNRLYAVLSHINETIVRTRDRERLLAEACRIAVEVGGFRLAWIGVVEHEAVRPRFWAGAAAGYLDGLQPGARDAADERSPSARALREDHLVVCNDIAADPAMAPWREAALSYDLRALVALPLRLRGRPVAVFTLWAGVADAFTDEELKLLDEVVMDLSFALESLEQEEERRRGEAERARLVTAVEQASEAVLITDVSGALQYVNPAFERITGYARAEVMGRNPRLLKSGQQDAAFYARLWDTLSRGETWHGRLTNRRRDGTLYEQATTISPIRAPAGDIVSFVAVARDVTREVALEGQLRQSQKMESLGQLAGGVAHDFNNLLTAIIGSAELALADLPPDAAVRPDLENMHRAASRGADLTRKLLAFSRRQRLAVRPVVLGDLVTEFSQMVRRVVREDVELVVRVEAPLPAILIDPGAVDQILMNLVTNARDAIRERGTITIELSRSVLTQDDCDLLRDGVPGAYAVLAVGDTGGGMSPEVRRRLFEPFFTSKEAGAGTGLGMAVVYGLVQEMRGFLQVESEVGRGTVVRVYLPDRPAGQTDDTPAPAPEIPHGIETVLVVEDEEDLRMFARRALEKHGYTVLTAGDGLDALTVLRAQGPAIALVLSDMVMPRMGGPQLERAMRAEGMRMPVLFTSGYPARSVDERRLREDDAHFLVKPWTVGEMLRRVREVLDARPG